MPCAVGAPFVQNQVAKSPAFGYAGKLLYARVVQAPGVAQLLSVRECETCAFFTE